jgi:hypothetical protein
MRSFGSSVLLGCCAAMMCGCASTNATAPDEPTGSTPARPNEVAKVPTVGEIEAQMSRERNVERALCTKAGPRKFTCRLVFSDQPDQRATVQILPNGDHIVGFDTGTLDGVGTATLPVP